MIVGCLDDVLHISCVLEEPGEEEAGDFVASILHKHEQRNEEVQPLVILEE